MYAPEKILAICPVAVVVVVVVRFGNRNPGRSRGRRLIDKKAAASAASLYRQHENRQGGTPYHASVLCSLI